MAKRKPKILYLDIETSHNIVASFETKSRGGLWIPYDNILLERVILCACWRWEGERKVYSAQAILPIKDDSDHDLLVELASVLKEADAVVAHFGDGFDLPYIRGRLAYHGLDPIPRIIQVDTYKLAKTFRLNSYKLDYLGKYFKVGQKIVTPPGLWLQVLFKASVKALNAITRYCKGDVNLLHDVYKVMLPYVKPKLNHRLFTELDVCDNCGSTHINYHGHQFTNGHKYHRFQCQVCGSWGPNIKRKRMED